MVSIKTDIDSDEVRRQGQHVLFVEGTGSDAIDPQILRALLPVALPLQIEPLGASFSIKSVAEALHPFHKNYYFLIDRDHHDDEFVDHCWDNFPNHETNNLLVWKRREIENYFLDPEYLFKSRYCQVEKETLERNVIQFSSDRLFLDAVNHVVISVREELKRNWIEKFSNPSEFDSEENALRKLLKANEFNEHRSEIGRMVSEEELRNRFESILEKMTGGSEQVCLDQGEWPKLVQGKKVLSQVVNSQCFRVPTTNGNELKSKEKLDEVVKNLLMANDEYLPEDFIALRDLIVNRVKGYV